MTEVQSITKSGEIKMPLSPSSSSSSSTNNSNVKSIPILSQCYSFSGKGNGKELQDKIFRQNSRHPNGGWKFVDDVELKKQRGVCWSLVKSVGNSIIEGKELTSTCLPIELFEARSFLEKVTDTMAFGPLYLKAAAETNDPIERMKMVASFVVSGLHLTTTIAKPFNPLLGETFECDLADGSSAFCEQISHHPPISSWKLLEKDGKYKYTGHFIWSAGCRGNVVKGCLKGPHNIEFADGTNISFTYPDVLIKGIFWGDRVTEFCGKMLFTDEKNDLACELIFNPNALGFVKSFFSKQKTPSDTIDGRIFRINNNKIKDGNCEKINPDDILCKMEGTWLTSFLIDQVEYWNIKMIPHGVIYRDPETTLPTDSGRRDDIKHLKMGNLEEAKKYKALIEDNQRKQKKEKDEKLKKEKKEEKKEEKKYQK
ncbi:hypothetical protein ACTFIU_001245 [Dictyostelium citrinum]